MDAGRLRKPTSSQAMPIREMSGSKSGKAQAAKRAKNAGSGEFAVVDQVLSPKLLVSRPSVTRTRCAHNS